MKWKHTFVNDKSRTLFRSTCLTRSDEVLFREGACTRLFNPGIRELSGSRLSEMSYLGTNRVHKLIMRPGRESSPKLFTQVYPDYKQRSKKKSPQKHTFTYSIKSQHNQIRSNLVRNWSPWCSLSPVCVLWMGRQPTYGLKSSLVHFHQTAFLWTGRKSTDRSRFCFLKTNVCHTGNPTIMQEHTTWSSFKTTNSWRPCGNYYIPLKTLLSRWKLSRAYENKSGGLLCWCAFFPPPLFRSKEQATKQK